MRNCSENFDKVNFETFAEDTKRIALNHEAAVSRFRDLGMVENVESAKHLAKDSHRIARYWKKRAEETK